VEVKVKVEDVNDSPPAFDSDKIVMYIAENSPVGSTVGEIHARDPDEGPNAVVQYSIIGKSRNAKHSKGQVTRHRAEWQMIAHSFIPYTKIF
jgi:cadherin EGF LAG seven-pass G-type receptor 1